MTWWQNAILLGLFLLVLILFLKTLLADELSLPQENLHRQEQELEEDPVTLYGYESPSEINFEVEEQKGESK